MIQELTLKSRRPIICVTVHRRYTELAQNLAASKALFAEFGDIAPQVVLIAAQPERNALSFFERLRSEGLISHLLFRPSNGLDGPVTTYPESQNIRLALSFCKDICGPGSSYVILQAADVEPNPGTYRFVNDFMQQDGDGVLFHWENGSARNNVWHTNFFAISLDNEASWPPIAERGDPDVLERKWGRQLDDQNYLGNWLRTHNSSEKRFKHRHLELSPLPSETEPLPTHPKKSWWKKWFFFLYLLVI